MVKLYCPKCMDVYTPKSSRHHHTDGAYFGTGFPHMLFMVHPEYRPKRPANQFVPRFVFSSYGDHLLFYINGFPQIALLHSPFPGSMVSRFTRWLTSYSCRQPPASRVPSKRSAKNLTGAGGGVGGMCIWCHGLTLLQQFLIRPRLRFKHEESETIKHSGEKLNLKHCTENGVSLVKTISVLNLHIENKVIMKARYL